MIFLVICKNKEDPIKNKGTRVVTRLSNDFSDTQGQLTQTNLKLIQASMAVLVTCKNEEDSSKNEGTRVVTTFLPL